jgi:CheY-like chemotaxis protein
MNAAASRQASAPVSRRVLIVEDHLDGARMMATLIRTMGHEVDYAINGYAAIALAVKLKPEVVFLDLALPDISGWAVARAIRAKPELQNVRIYAITGQYGEAASDRSLAAGCDRHLLKPLAPDLISELIGRQS